MFAIGLLDAGQGRPIHAECGSVGEGLQRCPESQELGTEAHRTLVRQECTKIVT